MIQTEDQLLKNLDLYYQLCSIEVFPLHRHLFQPFCTGNDGNTEHHVCLSRQQRHQSTDRRIGSPNSFCQARAQSHVYLRHVRLLRAFCVQVRRPSKKRRVRSYRCRYPWCSLDDDLFAVALDALVLVASWTSVYRRIHQKISLPRLWQ